MSTRGLDALDRVLDRGGEADDVLRSVVDVLVKEPGIRWTAVAFLEEGQLRLGPEAGVADESCRVRVPVTYRGTRVGELWADGEPDVQFLERVALLISAYVLIGWDTGGRAWEP